MPSTDSPSAALPLPRRQGKHPLAAWVWIVAFCLAVLGATYLMFVEPPPPRKFVIASGGRQGAYYRFARKYADELRKHGVTVEVRETAGSVENLRLLAEDGSGVAAAIIQGGVAGREQLQSFAALGSLYREPLWVFYRGEKPRARLADLQGKRINVGPPESGTFAMAMQLLKVNGLVDAGSPSQVADPRTVLVREDVASAARYLHEAKLDAGFFVAAFEANYIQALLNDPSVKLQSFDQQVAYHRRFRFLAPVTLPAGMVSFSRNVPDRDIALVAPTAELIVRKDFHPALVPLLLSAATEIHGKGDELSSPGEFPSGLYCDFSLSEDARHFYKSGQPMLQRLLPFWLASLADRAKVMLIPLVMLMMPLLRAAPPLMRWRTRRKIYRWYSDLRDTDRRVVTGLLTGNDLDRELERLKDVERQVAHVEVPLSYMEEVYHLRLHLAMLQYLIEMRTRRESDEALTTETRRPDFDPAD